MPNGFIVTQSMSSLTAIVDLVGKGGHIRTVPVPDWARNELNEWLIAAAIDRGETVPQSQQGREGMGRGDQRKTGVAHREGIRQDRWHSQISAA